MEDKEDEPEDVRKATPVEEEIRRGEVDEYSGRPERPLEQAGKRHRCEKPAGHKSKGKTVKSEGECCRNKEARIASAPKTATVLVYEKECTLPKLKAIPRHCLTKEEWINILATPNRKCPSPCLRKEVTRRIRPVSTRMSELAQPPKQRLLNTLESRAGVLPTELVDNLIQTLEGETCLTPEQAEQMFRDKDTRVKKKCRKRKNKLKCKGEKYKNLESGVASTLSSFDREAVNCQYIMAESFVRSILDWKCPVPKEEFKDIAEVILKRLTSILEYEPINGEDRKSQQMRFLADIIGSWISGVLFEVAEMRRDELEEECERRQKEKDEVSEDESDEDEDEDFVKKDDDDDDDDDDDKGGKRKRREDRRTGRDKDDEEKKKGKKKKDDGDDKDDDDDQMGESRTREVSEETLKGVEESPAQVEETDEKKGTAEDEVADQLESKDESGKVIDEDEPGKVIDKDEPGKVIEEDEPGKVIDKDEPGKVIEEDEPGKVIDKDEPGKVIEEDEPGKVIEEDEPGKVIDKDEPGKVIEEDEPGKVIDKDEPGKVIEEDEPGKVIDKDEPGKVIEEDEPGKVIDEAETIEKPEEKIDETGLPVSTEKHPEIEELVDAERSKQTVDEEQRVVEDFERAKEDQALVDSSPGKPPDVTAIDESVSSIGKLDDRLIPEATALEVSEISETTPETTVPEVIKTSETEPEARIPEESEISQTTTETALPEVLVTSKDKSDVISESEKPLVAKDTVVKTPQDSTRSIPTEELPYPAKEFEDLKQIVDPSQEPSTKKIAKKLSEVRIGKKYRTDTPFVTFDKIFHTIYNAIEASDENSGQDAIANRIHRAVYEKIATVVQEEHPGPLTELTRDVIDVMSGKVALMLRKIMTESEITFVNKFPATVESVEVRDWTSWISDASDTADGWSTWIRNTIKQAETMTPGNVTRGDYLDWTRAVDIDGTRYRRFFLEFAHRAHQHLTTMRDARVVKTGTRRLTDYEGDNKDHHEKEIKITDLEVERRSVE